MRGPNLFNQTFNFKLKKRGCRIMLFLLNATALFWSSNKEEAGRPLGRPLQMRSMGPLATSHEPLTTTYKKKTTMSMMNSGMRMATDQPM